MRNPFRRAIALSLAVLSLAACGPKGQQQQAQASAAASQPLTTIRVAAIGSPGSKTATYYMGILQQQQLLEKEFAKDGVKIEWVVLDGAGPAANEAIANGLADFANYGALPNIVARARGLKTSVLASYGYINTYVVARPGAGIDKPEDLKGKTVAVDIGHVTHLSLARVLSQYGLKPGDVKLVNMNATDAGAAVAAGKVDATLGVATLLTLVQQGKAKLVFDSRKGSDAADYFGALVVTKAFEQAHPDAVRRVLAQYLKAVAWASDPANRDAYLNFVSQSSSTPRAILDQDLAGRAIKDMSSPLLDDAYEQRFKDAASFSLANRLIREPVDLDGWFDRPAQDAALKDAGLQGFWTAHDASGHAPSAANQAAAANAPGQG